MDIFSKVTIIGTKGLCKQHSRFGNRVRDVERDIDYENIQTAVDPADALPGGSFPHCAAAGRVDRARVIDR